MNSGGEPVKTAPVYSNMTQRDGARGDGASAQDKAIVEVVKQARNFVEWAVGATREGNECCNFDLSYCADLIDALDALDGAVGEEAPSQ